MIKIIYRLINNMNFYILLNIFCLFFGNIFTSGFIFNPFHFNVPKNVDFLIDDLNHDIVNIVKEGDTNMHKIFDLIPTDINFKIFLKLTKVLPDLHAVGDKILIENEKLILHVINSDFSNEVKKKMIGVIIDATIAGDHMASDMLSMYRDMVNHIL